MDLIAADLALVLCTLVIATLLGAALRAAVRRGCVLETLVLGLTLLHEVFLVLLPVWLAVIMDFKYERAMAITVLPSDLAYVMTGEAVFVVLFLAGFRLSGRRQVARRGAGPLRLNRADLVLLVLLCLLGLAETIRRTMQPAISIDQATLHAEILRYSSPWDMLWQWTAAMSWLPSIFAAAILVVVRNVSTRWRVIGFSVMGAFVIYGLTATLRGRLTWPIVATIGLAWTWKRKRLLAAALAALFISLLTFPILGSESFRWYARTALAGQSRDTVLRDIGAELRESSDLGLLGFLRLFDTMLERAQGPRNAVVLYQLHDQGSAAGLRPILSAATFPVPRILQPQKPVAGSIDGTPYGAAMYLVSVLGHGSPYHTMGPVLASAHAYWEAGWLGLFAGGFLTGIVWSWIIRSARRKSKALGTLVVMMFMSSLLIDGLYTALVPIYSLIRMAWVSYLPIVVLHAAIGRFGPSPQPADPGPRRFAPAGPGRAFPEFGRLGQSA